MSFGLQPNLEISHFSAGREPNWIVTNHLLNLCSTAARGLVSGILLWSYRNDRVQTMITMKNLTYQGTLSGTTTIQVLNQSSWVIPHDSLPIIKTADWESTRHLRKLKANYSNTYRRRLEKSVLEYAEKEESLPPHVPAQNPVNLVAPYLSHTGRESVSRYVEALKFTRCCLTFRTPSPQLF
ncbi:hypothetical protein P9112_010017 [Eukaryota sp. TZLM1-RC]